VTAPGSGGRYAVVLREIGRGGMATVYVARQSDLDRLVALKELSALAAADTTTARRFVRESPPRRLAEPSEHGHGARLLRAPGHAVHRDGVPGARLAAAAYGRADGQAPQ
jgi:serine/threonine protein kinase